MERGQAERLMPLLAETLAAAGLRWRDLAALAVCVGPGNFTGVRIGVAAARGLALALERPAVGVSRLEALAFGRPGRTLVVAAGGRGGYAQVFRDGAPAGEPVYAPLAALPELAAGAVRVGLGGSPEAADAIPDPAALALIAARRLGQGAQPPPKPLYLRPPDAAPPSEAPPRILDAT